MSTIEALKTELDAERASRLLLETELKAVMENMNRKEVFTRCERPPKFCGKDNERADTWLFLNKQYFLTIGQDQDVRQCILIAATGFRENAAVWWEHVVKELAENLRPKMETWEDFEAAVKSEFQPLDSIQIARDKLADLIQTTSVTTYIGIMRDLALQIPDLSKGDLLHKFKRGLKPNIRKDVELRDPHTLDEAVRMAERADTIEMGNRFSRRQSQGQAFNRGQRPPFGQHNGPPRNFNGAQGSGPQNRYNGPAPMELDAMQGTRDNRGNWSQKKPRDFPTLSAGTVDRRDIRQAGVAIHQHLLINQKQDASSREGPYWREKVCETPLLVWDSNTEAESRQSK